MLFVSKKVKNTIGIIDRFSLHTSLPKIYNQNKYSTYPCVVQRQVHLGEMHAHYVEHVLAAGRSDKVTRQSGDVWLIVVIAVLCVLDIRYTVIAHRGIHTGNLVQLIDIFDCS